MVKKTKKAGKPATKKETTTKVVRISAKDTTNAEAPAAIIEKPVRAKAVKVKKSRKNPFASIGGYFKGSWYELTQVRWPNRRATWGLTGAVLIFSAFFVVFIVLLDILFKFVFEQLLG